MMVSPPRRFDVWDAIILAVATAVGVILQLGVTVNASPDESLPENVSIILIGINAVRPFLTAWTVAVLILALRAPRPAWRKLARKPGTAACGIATLVLIAVFAGISLESILTSCLGGGPGPTSATAPGEAPMTSPVTPASGAPVPVVETSLQALWSSLCSQFSSSAYAEDTIAGAWLIMAIGGWWRPERSWIDRLGRTVGATWITLMVVGYVAGWFDG
jgi:hypothetical protein